MSVIRTAPLLAALLLGACASRAPAPPPGEPAIDPVIAQECREEARRSSAAREAWRTQTPNNRFQTDIVNQRVADAEGQIFADCLRRRGVTRGGGVERVRTPGFF
jgi:hypothetical protein